MEIDDNAAVAATPAQAAEGIEEAQTVATQEVAQVETQEITVAEMPSLANLMSGEVDTSVSLTAVYFSPKDLRLDPNPDTPMIIQVINYGLVDIPDNQGEARKGMQLDFFFVYNGAVTAAFSWSKVLVDAIVRYSPKSGTKFGLIYKGRIKGGNGYDYDDYTIHPMKA